MKLQPRHFLLMIASLFVGLYLVNFFLHRRIETDRASHFGKYNESQILSMTASLCSMLVSETARLTYQPNKITMKTRGGTRLPIWQVDCIDGEGTCLFELNWDAQTGDLTSFSRQSEEGVESWEPLDNGPAAAHTACNWLRDLHIVQKTSACRLMKPPQRKGTIWYGHFRTDEREVRVAVNSATGALRTLWSRRKMVTHPTE